MGLGQAARGAAKKKMRKTTCICRSAKKKVATHFILFLFLFLFFNRFLCKAFFGRFVTRGVQKHEKNVFSKKSIWQLAISRLADLERSALSISEQLFTPPV
jgi:hypothetical protein